MGFRDGSIYLSLKFSVEFPYYDSFEKYLKTYKLVSYNDACVPHEEMYCDAITHEEMKTLLEIVSQHNTFPDEDLERVRKIVEQGYWKPQDTDFSDRSGDEVGFGWWYLYLSKVPYPDRERHFEATKRYDYGVPPLF